MCTVSFYKDKQQTIITSNRDEHHSRPQSFAPTIYYTKEYQLIYCKDAQANGTWMALRSDDTAIVLLNGAFERHSLSPPYRKSRGLVLLDIINEKDCLLKYREYDLTNIEPFTIIIYSNHSLHECIWNGTEKFITEKPTEEKYIWSSVTLYDKPFRDNKHELYKQLIQSKEDINNEDILQFHHSKQDTENGFVINRNNQLLTFSVTQIVLTNTQASFYHHDIINDKNYTLTQDDFNKAPFL